MGEWGDKRGGGGSELREKEDAYIVCMHAAPVAGHGVVVVEVRSGLAAG